MSNTTAVQEDMQKLIERIAMYGFNTDPQELVEFCADRLSYLSLVLDISEACGEEKLSDIAARAGLRLVDVEEVLAAKDTVRLSTLQRVARAVGVPLALGVWRPKEPDASAS